MTRTEYVAELNRLYQSSDFWGVLRLADAHGERFNREFTWPEECHVNALCKHAMQIVGAENWLGSKGIVVGEPPPDYGVR